MKITKQLCFCFLVVLSMVCLSYAAPPLTKKLRVLYWMNKLSDKDPVVRIDAARALGKLKSSDAIPALIQRLDDVDLATYFPPPPGGSVRMSSVDYEAAKALIKIGPIGIPALTEGLDEQAPKIRGGCAMVLGQLGPEARASSPRLLELLNDQDPAVRFEASRALYYIAPDLRADVNQLQVGLKDPDPDVRIFTLFSLGDQGAPAELSVPGVISLLLNDMNRKVRACAAETLGRIGVQPQVCVPLLASRINEDNACERVGAIKALGMFGPSAIDAAPLLLMHLDGASPALKQAIISALEQISPDSVKQRDVGK